MEKKRRSFYRLTVSTVVAVYLLIMVGGIVRSTGSGMGCPDWPKCFGSWVPPTSVSDLPSDYKEQYAAYRAKKNMKFANYLNAFGMTETATAILQDKSILVEADFNPTKTLVEYVNRLVGVAIGLFVFAVFVYSLKFWPVDKGITILGLASFLLVGFQGWIGSFVVSTNLTPWTITIHMGLALLIVAMLILLLHRINRVAIAVPVSDRWLLVACMAALLFQILLGTQVREAVDIVATKFAREEWVANLNGSFIIHRSFSWLVLALHGLLIYNLYKTGELATFNKVLMALVVITILVGVGMAYLAIPPYLQPLHLLLASMTFGWQFLFYLKLTAKAQG